MARQVTAVAHATAPKESEVDRRVRLMRKKPSAEIIRLAVNALRVKESAQREYDICCDALSDRFDSEKMTDQIITEEGVAERKITNKWNVLPEKVLTLWKKLGAPEYATAIEETMKYTVPEPLMPGLVEFLGNRVDDFVTSSRSFTVTPAARARSKNDADFAKTLGIAVDIESTVSIKVKPVNRD